MIGRRYEDGKVGDRVYTVSPKGRRRLGTIAQVRNGGRAGYIVRVEYSDGVGPVYARADQVEPA